MERYTNVFLINNFRQKMTFIVPQEKEKVVAKMAIGSTEIKCE